MKIKLLLVALTCALSSSCSTSQAQPTTESVNSTIANPSVLATTPVAEANTPPTDISKSSIEPTSDYQCQGTNNHLFLGNGVTKNRYGNPIYVLHLCIGGKEQRSFKIVTGRNFTQQKNRNQSGTHSPLPNGKYRMSTALTQGMLAEVGRVDGLNVRQPFLPISPMFGTGRSALGIHVDPSYNIDPKEDGTSGCIGLTNPADFKALWASIRQYRIKDLQVAINTRAIDNPNVADRE
jgi:hypothetical protein